MLRSVVASVALLVAASTAGADPLYGLFRYEAPRPPVAGDCNAIAASIGPAATWYGEFAGNRYDTLFDNYSPFSARGCFESEFACRVWQNDAITYLGQGTMLYATCRQGI